MNLPWEIVGSGGAGFLFGIGVHIGATRAALRSLTVAFKDLKKQMEKNEEARNIQCQAHLSRVREIELDVAFLRGVRGSERTPPTGEVLRGSELKISGGIDK